MRNYILRSFLISCCLLQQVAHAQAQRRFSEFDRDLSANPSHLNGAPRIGDDDPVSGSGTVFLFALAGTAIGSGIGFARLFALTFMSDQSHETDSVLPVLAGAGAATGGLLGAAVGERKPAFFPTVAGTAVGTVPLFLVARSEAEIRPPASFLIWLLPAAGAWFGNLLGQ